MSEKPPSLAEELVERDNDLEGRMLLRRVAAEKENRPLAEKLVERDDDLERRMLLRRMAKKPAEERPPHLPQQPSLSVPPTPETAPEEPVPTPVAEEPTPEQPKRFYDPHYVDVESVIGESAAKKSNLEALTQAAGMPPTSDVLRAFETIKDENARERFLTTIRKSAAKKKEIEERLAHNAAPREVSEPTAPVGLKFTPRESHEPREKGTRPGFFTRFGNRIARLFGGKRSEQEPKGNGDEEGRSEPEFKPTQPSERDSLEEVENEPEITRETPRETLPSGPGAEELDSLHDEAVLFVREKQVGSISQVQRHFRIGYIRAARLLEELEAAGVVGSADPQTGRRPVLGRQKSDHLPALATTFLNTEIDENLVATPEHRSAETLLAETERLMNTDLAGMTPKQRDTLMAEIKRVNEELSHYPFDNLSFAEQVRLVDASNKLVLFALHERVERKQRAEQIPRGTEQTRTDWENEISDLLLKQGKISADDLLARGMSRDDAEHRIQMLRVAEDIDREGNLTDDGRVELLYLRPIASSSSFANQGSSREVDIYEPTETSALPS